MKAKAGLPERVRLNEGLGGWRTDGARPCSAHDSNPKPELKSAAHEEQRCCAGTHTNCVKGNCRSKNEKREQVLLHDRLPFFFATGLCPMLDE